MLHLQQPPDDSSYLFAVGISFPFTLFFCFISASHLQFFFFLSFIHLQSFSSTTASLIESNIGCWFCLLELIANACRRRRCQQWFADSQLILVDALIVSSSNTIAPLIGSIIKLQWNTVPLFFFFLYAARGSGFASSSCSWRGPLWGLGQEFLEFIQDSRD